MRGGLAVAGAAGAERAGGLAGRSRIGDDPLWRRLTLAPAVVVMALLAALPIANMLAMSFFNVSWVEARAVWTPVGLDNYRAIPDDNLVRAGVVNTLVFVVAAVTVEMVLGFFLALYCSRVGRGRVVYRTIFLLPILVPGIVIGAMWKLMYNFDFGIINQAIGLVGLPPHDWLGAYETALLSVIIVDIWHWTPFCFLLLLAAIESLPQDVAEAAKIDGATGWQELIHVTLPMLRPAILVTLGFRTLTAFKVFDEVYLLTGGGPGTATEVLSFTIYQRFFTEDRVGYGSALSIAVMFGVALLLVVMLTARRGRAQGAPP